MRRVISRADFSSAGFSFDSRSPRCRGLRFGKWARHDFSNFGRRHLAERKLLTTFARNDTVLFALCSEFSFPCRSSGCICVCESSFQILSFNWFLHNAVYIIAAHAFSRRCAWGIFVFAGTKKKSLRFGPSLVDQPVIVGPRTFLGFVFQRYIFIVLAGSKQLTLSASIRHMVARDKGIAFYFPADVTADRMPRHVYEYKGSFNCASITPRHRRSRISAL